MGNEGDDVVLPRDGLGPEAFDELAGHAGLHRRYEVQPEGRQARREHRHLDDQRAAAAQVPDLQNHVPTCHDLGARDVERAVEGLAAPGDAGEVANDVLQRDRLRPRPHPARTDHHGQAIDECDDRLEGSASVSYDDRRTQRGHRHRTRGEPLSRLRPATEVERACLRGIAESAEEDDLTHAGALGRLGDGVGGDPIPMREVLRAEGVHQVVDDIDARKEAVEFLALGDVRGDPVHPVAAAVRRVPRDCHHLVLSREQRQKRAADDAARPEDGDLHGRLSRTNRAT